MGGTLELNALLQGMQPELDEKAAYVFLTIPHDMAKRSAAVVGDIVASQAIASFHEAEGLTVVVRSTFLADFVASSQSEAALHGAELKAFWKALAEREELPPMSHITMRIHSSLSAVGFTAAFSRALTEAGISCNVFAGYFHDHIFVPAALQSNAMSVLTALSQHSSDGK